METPPPPHKRGQPERLAAPAHGVQQGDHEPAARGPDRVAEADARPVDVGDLAVEAEVALAGEVLGGERLVDLEQLEVGEASPERRSRSCTAGTGLRPMTEGSQPP